MFGRSTHVWGVPRSPRPLLDALTQYLHKLCCPTSTSERCSEISTCAELYDVQQTSPATARALSDTPWCVCRQPPDQPPSPQVLACGAAPGGAACCTTSCRTCGKIEQEAVVFLRGPRWSSDSSKMPYAWSHDACPALRLRCARRALVTCCMLGAEPFRPSSYRCFRPLHLSPLHGVRHFPTMRRM